MDAFIVSLDRHNCEVRETENFLQLLALQARLVWPPLPGKEFVPDICRDLLGSKLRIALHNDPQVVN